MRIMVKLNCTAKTLGIGPIRAIDNYERWRCGCVKCTKELKEQEGK